MGQENARSTDRAGGMSLSRRKRGGRRERWHRRRGGDVGKGAGYRVGEEREIGEKSTRNLLSLSSLISLDLAAVAACGEWAGTAASEYEHARAIVQFHAATLHKSITKLYCNSD